MINNIQGRNWIESNPALIWQSTAPWGSFHLGITILTTAYSTIDHPLSHQAFNEINPVPDCCLLFSNFQIVSYPNSQDGRKITASGCTVIGITSWPLLHWQGSSQQSTEDVGKWFRFPRWAPGGDFNKNVICVTEAEEVFGVLFW